MGWEHGGVGKVPLAPTRILFCVLFFRKRFTRPQGNWVRAEGLVRCLFGNGW